MPLIITPTILPTPTVGIPYKETIILSGQTPYSMDFVSLPDGLTLDQSKGQITGDTINIEGTPTRCGVIESEIIFSDNENNIIKIYIGQIQS